MALVATVVKRVVVLVVNMVAVATATMLTMMAWADTQTATKL